MAKESRFMKLYLCGPMTGIEEFNRPEFARVESRLVHAGYEVESPHRLTGPKDDDWQSWMRLALAQLLRCDGVAWLDGWAQSRGAIIEIRTAQDLGMPAKHWESWI